MTALSAAPGPFRAPEIGCHGKRYSESQRHPTQAVQRRASGVGRWPSSAGRHAWNVGAGGAPTRRAIGARLASPLRRAKRAAGEAPDRSRDPGAAPRERLRDLRRPAGRGARASGCDGAQRTLRCGVASGVRRGGIALGASCWDDGAGPSRVVAARGARDRGQGCRQADMRAVAPPSAVMRARMPSLLDRSPRHAGPSRAPVGPRSWRPAADLRDRAIAPADPPPAGRRRLRSR